MGKVCRVMSNIPILLSVVVVVPAFKSVFGHKKILIALFINK